MENKQKSSDEALSEPLQQCSVSGSYTILDEIPKEGDYGINPQAPDKKPRLVVRYSDENSTLGMRLESPSWFEWMPLRNSHRKVVFNNCH